MNQEEKPISEENAAQNLKEVYQKFDEDHRDDSTTSKDQSGSDEAAKELEGSDADIDVNVGYDDAPDSDEAAEQVKGSDADTA